MKKPFKPIASVALTAITLISIPVAAQASNWFLLTSSESGTKFFLDRDSITRNGTTVRASVFAVYEQPNKGTVGYIAAREFSCTDKKLRDIQTTYLEEDSSTEQNNDIDQWRSMEPGSVGYGMIQKVCGY